MKSTHFVINVAFCNEIVAFYNKKPDAFCNKHLSHLIIKELSHFLIAHVTF